jgi:hypothetical protein
MKYGLDWKIVYSIIYIESYFRTNAASIPTKMKGDSAK